MKKHRQFNYTGTCDIYHKIAVIGLSATGYEVIKELLDMGVDPVDIVAVDAFDPDKLSVKTIFHDTVPKLKEAFPEATEYPGIVMIPETNSMIINHFTDDLSYAPAGVCSAAIIVLDDNAWNKLECVKEMATLVRFGISPIFVVNDKNCTSVMKQVEAILPTLL